MLADNFSLESYVQLLVNSYPSLSEVWLLGSRADATYKPDSDWDLLVFADRHAFDKMKGNGTLRVSKFDLLVVFDEDHFEQPWTEEGYSVPKQGSLTDWQWRKESDSTSSYSCSRRRCRRTAKRLWPAAQ